MSHRRWMSPTESLLVITVEEEAFLTTHGIDQHDVYDAGGGSAIDCSRKMRSPVNMRYRVAINVEPCSAGHAMRDRLGACVMCNPILLYDQPPDAELEEPLVLDRLATPGILTDEEAEFMRHHGIGSEKLYYARGRPRRIYGPIMKANGYIAATQVTRCHRGHALRDRKGTCLVCFPASMKFLERHSSAGWVYVAYSRAGRIYKVGTSNDLDDRLEQLNIHQYGGHGDWRIVDKCWSDEAGRAEHRVQTLLAEHGVEGDYGGRPEYCRELFRCNRKVALAALRAGTGGKTAT